MGGMASVRIPALILLPSFVEEECSGHPVAEIPLILGHCPRVPRQNKNCYRKEKTKHYDAEHQDLGSALICQAVMIVYRGTSFCSLNCYKRLQ